MLITNTTDVMRDTNPKMIGIGEYRILPGETANIPDSVSCIIQNGKKVPIPAISALAKTRQIKYEMIPDAAAPNAYITEEEPDVPQVKPDAQPEAEEISEEERKAAIAAKRAATRAANKAAKEAANASEESAE